MCFFVDVCVCVCLYAHVRVSLTCDITCIIWYQLFFFSENLSARYFHVIFLPFLYQNSLCVVLMDAYLMIHSTIVIPATAVICERPLC